MCAHKFHPSRYSRLDSAERRRILPIEKILETLRPLRDLTVVDVGCGTGYFTIPFSKEVGSEGKVYAVDTSDEMLTVLKERVSQAANIVPILSKESSIPLEKGIADVIFMSAVYHEFEDRQRMIEELMRVSHSQARLVVIDWSPHSDEQGPPLEHRVPPAVVKEEFSAAGCHLARRFDPDPSFYGMIFTGP
jgi:ubiquinone/menaquinone biosynthesis C-methylase UbiE